MNCKLVNLQQKTVSVDFKKISTFQNTQKIDKITIAFFVYTAEHMQTCEICTK